MSHIALSEMAYRLRQLSQQYWVRKAALLLIGMDPKFLEAQAKLKQYALVDKPVLITGETGVGKEAFARSLYLLSKRRGKPFLTVNSAQYQDDNLLVSELFGHKKGSYTGATSDRRGLFEEANEGVLFLDEIGELSLKAQAMLLRALSEGEIKPLGSTRVSYVNVRMIAATNRNLEKMVQEGTFRKDLYYRLRYLRLRIPPIRERGNDWQHIADYYLNRLALETDVRKRFSPLTVNYLTSYHWPGNVREIQGVVDMGYCLSNGQTIEPQHIMEEIEKKQSAPVSAGGYSYLQSAQERFEQMLVEGNSFWEVVRRPFLEREINRAEVRHIIQAGLQRSGGSYKCLLPDFGIPESEYLKFMDFLRHHRLKPEKIERSHYSLAHHV